MPFKAVLPGSATDRVASAAPGLSTANRKPIMRNVLPTLVCVFLGLMAGDLQAASIKLDSREYKLMLQPNKFAGNETAKIVDRFWDQQLKPVIATRLDARADGTSRSKKNFKLDKERVVFSRDTKHCLLDRNGYSLRERVRLRDGDEDASSREVTLKFRTSDLFLAAETELNGSSNEASTKFEEDIAPIIVPIPGASTDSSRVVAQPRSMRSLFSVSTKEAIPDATLKVLGDVMNVYPSLQSNLRKAGAPDQPKDSKLNPGIRIHELVFEGAKVDLGHDTDGEFALTLWYSQKPHELLTAEISFKYDTEDGRVKEAVARRALQLFEGMQQDLGDWSSPEHATKTKLALPACH
jgi:hypothetical protein